jgi:hypothetical protein
MTVELTNEELKMIDEALWDYLSNNDSMNADLIINIMDKIDKEII